MLKLSMNISLLSAIFILVGFTLLYEPLSMNAFRYVAVIFTVSAFFVPVVFLFNLLLSGIRSLKPDPGWGWMFLLVSIVLSSHVFISLIVSLVHIHPVSAELVWLILNTSIMLALLIRVRTVHQLLKTFYHEQDVTYSIG
jgi:hypothetical protein